MRRHGLKYVNTPTVSPEFDLFNYEAGLVFVQEIEKSAPFVVQEMERKTVLDIGCGYGSAFIAALKNLPVPPKRIIHVDANDRVFARRFVKKDEGRSYETRRDLKKYWERDEKVCGDAHDLPFVSNLADIVFTEGMFWDNWGMTTEGRLVSMLDHEKIAKEIHRVLKNGGVYIGDGSLYADYVRHNFEIGAHIHGSELLIKK